MLTKMYTLLEAVAKLGLDVLVDQPRGGVVVSNDDWGTEQASIKKRNDVLRAGAKVEVLGQHGLETAKQQKFCTFPMRGRSGLFEIRVNGVRFYGGRLGTAEKREVSVLLGAEDKDGNNEADRRILDRCVLELKGLQKAFEAFSFVGDK